MEESIKPDRRLRDLLRLARLERTDGRRRWSQARAAEAAGLSAIRWRQIERGGSVPPATLAQMLDAVGVDPVTLRSLGYEDLAAVLQQRRELLKRSPFADPAEAHLWATPGVSEPVRRVLILTLRTMRQAGGHDPLTAQWLSEIRHPG